MQSARTEANTIAEYVWDLKYRYRDGEGVAESCIEDTWRRVARAVASVEAQDRERWAQTFYDLVDDLRFLPAGRILASAGTQRQATLCSCFVMGSIEDHAAGLFRALQEGAETLRAGGGIGFDLSTIAPEGERRSGTMFAGPIGLMHVWDAICENLAGAGGRRGATMGSLRCDHPDIEAFIEAKRGGGLSHFNCSVLVTDGFMRAVQEDGPWTLEFGGRPEREVAARTLWRKLLSCAYETGDPGVIFIDRVNALNNLSYAERILTTNPCGEVPLPEYGACDLASFNLTRFVREPFTPQASIDVDALARHVPAAVRFLDNVLALSLFPLPRQAEVARRSRRIGLGITGLGDALAMLNLGYGEPAARDVAASVMRAIRDSAYAASADLAQERGAFPVFDAEKFLATPNGLALPAALRTEIARKGMRNSHLTSIAPTGSISLLANNVSSGIEPIFALTQERSVAHGAGSAVTLQVDDYAYTQWRKAHPGVPLPAAFVEASGLTPSDHIAMAAAVQPYVDNAIAKTINIAGSASFDEFSDCFFEAYQSGLKGCTVFRPTREKPGVLSGVCRDR